MSLIENAKEIADLVKKMGDIELYRKIVHLEGEIIELTRSRHDLERDNTTLKQSLDRRAAMTYVHPFFHDAITGHSCCPQCWQSQEKIVYVIGPVKWHDNDQETIAFKCPTCRTSYRSINGQWVSLVEVE